MPSVVLLSQLCPKDMEAIMEQVVDTNFDGEASIEELDAVRARDGELVEVSPLVSKRAFCTL